MPARKTNPTNPTSNLARSRIKAGITQADMAAWIGVSLRTYRRLEQLDVGLIGPGSLASLGLFVNCALTLRVPFDEVAPEGWERTWTLVSWKAPDGPPTEAELEARRRQWE